MKRYILILGILITTMLSYAQTVTTGATADYYVNDVLVGGGITVSNVTINTTSADVIGEFAGCAATNIGIDHGLILACGDVNLALGPNTQTGAGATVGSGSDPDLQELLGSTFSINDAVVLEFDFIPLSNHVEFNYVFASEEFPEYVNSSFNDVFGFFVSGPGISGPYSGGSMNVALMPSSTNPVTIDNVYPTAYYVDNTGGTTVEYDGFTTVLTAAFDVTPCVVYHIKIAVGDAGDSAYDSAIFLEANSFSSNALNIDLAFSDTTSTGTVIEGCGEAIISFSLEEPVSSDTTITYTLGGTATNGTDYNNLSGNIQFNAGEDSTAIVIIPVLDGITEGDETIEIIIQTSACGTDTIVITIVNDQQITADFTTSPDHCEGDTVHIEYTGNGTLTDTYTWDFAGGVIVSGSGQGPYDIILPVGSSNISLQADAENGCTTANTQQTVTIDQMPTATFDSETICEGDIAGLVYTGNASNSATYNWVWPTACSGATLIGSDSDPDSLTIQFGMGTSSDPACSPAQITLQVTENGCTSEVGTGSVNILPPGTTGCCEIPNPYAGADADVCGLIYFMNGDAPAAGNNMDWVIISSPPSSSATFDNINSWTTQVSVTMAGSYTFGYHETSGNCDSTDQVTITFYPTINSFAGNDTSFCSTTGTLNAVSTSGTIGHWLNTPGVTITPTTSPNAAISGAYGTYILYWVEETTPNPVCSDTSTVVVSFLQVPSGSVTGADTCGNTVCLHADTLGNWGPGYSGYWTGPTGAFYLPSDTATDVCITILPNWGTDNYVTETFQWHVSNNGCESSEDIDIVFEQPGALSYPGNNDQTCESSYQMHAMGTGVWSCNDSRLDIITPADSATWITIDPNMIEWTDSSQVEFTLIWSVNSNGTSGSECTASSWVIITFFEQPQAYAGEDIGICGLEWRLNAVPSINASEGTWTIDSMPAGASVTFGDGSQADQDTNATSVTVTEYGVYYFVWHENNMYNEFCSSTDTVAIEFIRIPEITAGDDDYVCGWRYQMTAQMDASGTSAYGTWQNAPVYWTDSAWIDSTSNTATPIELDPSQQQSPTAYITLPVTEQQCEDSVIMVWQEYSIGTFSGTQCVAKDTAVIHFYADIQADNSTVSVEPEICGREIDLTNSQDLYCATGYWIDSLSSVVSWDPSDHSPNTTATVGGYITDAFAYVIENGHIPGSNFPVCQDTSEFVTVTFKQKPQVDACPGCYRLYHGITSTGDYVDSVRTDTVCFEDAGEFYILHPYNNIGSGTWSKASSGSFFANGIPPSYNTSITKNDSVFVNIWSSAGVPGNDYYTLVWTATNSANGCESKDTLLLSIAKNPSGNIGFRRPYCNGESALIWAEPDNDANPTDWNWQFTDNPTIDSTESGSSNIIDSLKQGIHYVRWTNSGDCDELEHVATLVSSSDWGCYSSSNTETIKEPGIVYPQFDNIDATCGQNNGMIKVIKDTITVCGDTIDHTILTAWQNSTMIADPSVSTLGDGTPVNGIPTFAEQINYGANNVIDSIYGLSPNDTSCIEVDYISLITLDPGYVGDQHHCKDTLCLVIKDSGHIDAIIDDGRMDNLNPDLSHIGGNLTGTAPLDVTMYHNTLDASKYNWIIRDEEGNIIYDSNDEFPSYTFPQGNYEIDLIVKSREGCYDTTAYRFIMVDSESFIEIPNLFTPNGDGVNDYFQIYARSLKAFKGFIINRWGKVLYEWDDWTTENAGWDGKIGNNYASPGVYFYVIRYKGVYDDNETEIKGAFELVREQ